ncbi:oxalyl-CoA decarboxylase [Escherichia coli]|uniref:Oxalyl-CoA decarboxylase n=1 Tax=Escherichia coli TaxID=562 RepID=A0A2X3JTD5_ECOLX|nr:oxalyl-CoA decarboxylase [Escherichia coli]
MHWHALSRVSVSGRPGGVYLDLPANVLAATMEKDEALTTIVKVENPSPALLPCPKSVTSAISLLAKAERPLIILGKGAAYSQADEQLREFIESTQIPFLPMSMAKGILEDTHPLSAAAARSFALANADVVHACWCTTELVIGNTVKKDGRQIHSLFNWILNRRKLTATAPLLCQSLVILHPVCKVCWQN